jgi:hypothetical protein
MSCHCTYFLKKRVSYNTVILQSLRSSCDRLTSVYIDDDSVRSTENEEGSEEPMTLETNEIDALKDDETNPLWGDLNDLRRWEFRQEVLTRFQTKEDPYFVEQQSNCLMLQVLNDDCLLHIFRWLSVRIWSYNLTRLR